MVVIASNLTTRGPKIEEMFRKLKLTDWVCDKEPQESLRRLVKRCSARADVIEINTQQHHDIPSVMEAAVEIAQRGTERQLCLSSNNVDALEAGLGACNCPPIVNYVSIDEKKLRDVFPLGKK